MLSTKAIALSVLSLAASSVTAYESDWKAIGGALIQVSFDGHQVCGVSPSNVILCATDNLDSTPVWQPIAGPAGKPGFKWVALWGANLWAVNTNDEIWYGQSSGDPNWVQLPGSLKQISADGKQICGCNKDNQIWCADQGITSNPQWRQLPGALTQLDLTDGVIYGIAPDDSIWFGMSDGEPSFTRITGGLRQIAFDGELLCGTNSANDIYCADSGLKSSPNWRNIPGKLTQLDVQAGRVFGVNSANNIWHKYFTKPINMWDGWRVVQGKTFTAINYDGKSICGVDPNQDVYCATKGFHDGSTQWRQLNGTKLMKVAVWGDSIWGVDKANNIWYGQMNGDPQWRQVSGSLKQISTDGKQICGCDSKDDIWCADTNITTTPNWRSIPGKLQHLSVLNGVLFGTNHDNNIYTGRATGDPKWIQLQGQLATLEYDGRSLCGVNAGGDVWCSDSGLQQGTPNWRRLDTGYLYASVNGGKMFVITGTGTLLSRMDL